MSRFRHRVVRCCAAAFATAALLPQLADACTRIVYLGAVGGAGDAMRQQVITARSMDWASDIKTNLWILPRGAKRNGETGQNTMNWTSRYGSVIASTGDEATTDGINEAGLVANVLWLAESIYPKFPDGDKLGMAISIWPQYVLDNYATVAEAVTALAAEPFIVVTDKMPNENRAATLHLSLSDASGDSAIIEYIDGRQVIHHSRKYQVMTNSPAFDQQLALNAYWQQIGGLVMLPGTNRAADRFVRASFYINAIAKPKTDDTAVASVFSVIRNASVPFGILPPKDQPNISSTRWRSVADQGRRLYFFESALTPNVFWVDLKKIDFSPRDTDSKLDLGENETNIFSGEVHNQFRKSPPIKFKGL